jgi:hypothetical protein
MQSFRVPALDAILNVKSRTKAIIGLHAVTYFSDNPHGPQLQPEDDSDCQKLGDVNFKAVARDVENLSIHTLKRRGTDHLYGRRITRRYSGFAPTLIVAGLT